MINWMFDNPRRLNLVTLAMALAIATLGVVFISGRINRIPQQSFDAPPTATATPESTATGLLPPSPAASAGSPTPDYGSSAPVALEAVQAFLLADHSGFARLAQPEAVESVNEAPAPPAGQQITGNVKTLLGGPTRQQVQVLTTDGPLILDMIVVDGAWKVQEIRYQR